MTWFNTLTGLADESRQTVYSGLAVEGGRLVSKANGKSFEIGDLSQPSLQGLRSVALSSGERTSVTEIVADAQSLHTASENAGAVFQVASQFNLLEMIGPSVTPEDGVGRYEADLTQGPACAIACGAGTIYRNYFMRVGRGVGQSRTRQVDCLADLGNAVDNDEQGFWRMQNGYALPVPGGLARLNSVLQAMSPKERDAVGARLRVGVQAETEVTLDGAGHRVTQVYCSAMPVAYGEDPADDWAPMAKLVLNAAYEATLRIAARNLERCGIPVVYLTLLGGGAFGNRNDWIEAAIRRALDQVRDAGLDVRLVSYGRSNPAAQHIVSDWAGA